MSCDADTLLQSDDHVSQQHPCTSPFSHENTDSQDTLIGSTVMISSAVAEPRNLAFETAGAIASSFSSAAMPTPQQSMVDKQFAPISQSSHFAGMPTFSKESFLSSTQSIAQKGSDVPTSTDATVPTPTHLQSRVKLEGISNMLPQSSQDEVAFIYTSCASMADTEKRGIFFDPICTAAYQMPTSPSFGQQVHHPRLQQYTLEEAEPATRSCWPDDRMASHRCAQARICSICLNMGPGRPADKSQDFEPVQKCRICGTQAHRMCYGDTFTGT